ncbi:hypothetical protein ACQ4PT_064424 [Festuca glaucescens]
MGGVKQDMEELHKLIPWVIILLLSYGAGSISCDGNDTDLASLVDFKRAISNDPMEALSSWNTTVHFCLWEGVACSTTRPGRVVTLSLTGRNLAGQISPSLGNMSHLVSLNLSTNKLSGHIPPLLGNLHNLKILDLRDNALQGNIPDALTNCSSLIALDLSRNLLVGEIPRKVGLLSVLSYFRLNGNSLTGTIPPGLGNITTLRNIFLQGNQLHGSIPEELGKLPSLLNLLLGVNRLSGRIPEALFNISSLQQLAMPVNMLHGSLPSGTGDFLPNLTQLLLSSNMLEGQIPDSLGNASELQRIALGNELTGQIPISLGKLRKLGMLNLEANNLQARDSKSWEFLDALSNCTLLEFLSLQEAQLQGVLPDSVGNLSSNLDTLLLGRNMLYGLVPPSIGNLHGLTKLGLELNTFSGPIDGWIENLVNLEELYIGGNNFTGHIPGQIPYVASLKQLNYLDLSSNKLSGQIPLTLGTCQQLQIILGGSIPVIFGNFSILTMLNLSHNNFSGSIPIPLSKLELLTYLDLSHNNLEGGVPTEGVFKNTTRISLKGNLGLCGGVLGLHMPQCPKASRRRTTWRHYFAIPILGGVVSVSLLIYFIISRKKVSRVKLSMPFSSEQFPKVSYKDLAQATENFSESNLIGRGSHGSVYKGRLLISEPMVVVVKVFDLAMEGDDRSFMSECQALKNIRHRNILPVLTACSTIDNTGNDFRALVYRFMPNGSLDTWLHQSSNRDANSNLDLVQRLKIVVDIADALQYIHHDCESPIIHRDLKPSNILLDDDMTAHLGDFGIARFYLETSPTVGDSRSVGTLTGTIGYIPPEYAGGSYLSTSGDVYSFGVVLLEILTGKRPTDSLFCNGLNIVNFVERNFPDQILDMVDAYLLESSQQYSRANPKEENRVFRCLLALVKLALSCTHQAPDDRPNMREVATKLREIKIPHIG